MKSPNIYIIDVELYSNEGLALPDIPISKLGAPLETIQVMDLIVVADSSEFCVLKDRLSGYNELHPIDELPEFLTDFISRWYLIYEDDANTDFELPPGDY